MKRMKELPLGVYEKAICFSLPWEEKLQLAKESGFDFIEYSVDGEQPGTRLNRLYDGKSAKEVRDASRNTGVPVYTMALTANRYYPMGSADKTLREKGVEIVQRGVDFALEAGIQLIHLAAYEETDGSTNEATRGNLADSFAQCVDYAAARCFTLAVENIDIDVVGGVAATKAFIEQFHSPYLQVYADIGNIYAMGREPEADLGAARGHIAGVHIKETKPGVVRDIPFGEGSVDFGRCFRALAELGYNGVFVAEMWSHDKEEFHQYLKTAQAFIKNAMGDY